MTIKSAQKVKFTGRFKVAMLVILYMLSFNWMYISWLSQQFDYMGFVYNKPDVTIMLVSHFIAWLPVLWMPLKLNRPSVLIYWFIFLMTYIPSILLPVYMKLSTESDLYILIFTLLAGMFIVGCCYFVPVGKFKSFLIGEKKFLKSLYALTIFLISYIIYIFKGKMRLVGLDDIYELRFANDSLSHGNLVDYAVIALGNCIFPFFLALGLVRKNYRFIILSVLGQIFLYATEGSKAYLFSSIIILLIYYTIRKSATVFSSKFLSSIIILTLVLTVLVLYGPDEWMVFTAALASLVFMRSLCIGGVLTAQYYYFFETHPKTYYSHINIVSQLIKYPYGKESVGIVIGYQFNRDKLVNSNANFWATDGIAAAGSLGILLISILLAIVFWTLDSIAVKHNIVFTSLSIVIISISLLNTSLFTTLLSGGLALMIILFSLMPKVHSGS